MEIRLKNIVVAENFECNKITLHNKTHISSLKKLSLNKITFHNNNTSFLKAIIIEIKSLFKIKHTFYFTIKFKS